MQQGWIKLYRSLSDKAIWRESTPEQKTILITLLLMADHKENEWEWKGEKYKTKPGQFITSLPKIAEEAGKGITIQNVRTALKRFEKYGFLTDESTNKNRLITIVNWGIYQHSNDEANSQANRQLTGNQQATNRQLTSNNNVINKELKEDKNKERDISADGAAPSSSPIVKEVINYLNEKTGKRFSHKSEANSKLINARLREGRTIDDFKHVIDVKTEEWMNDEKMSEYLRPATLFSGKNFEGYVNQRSKRQHQSRQLDDREKSIAKEIAFNRWMSEGNSENDFHWDNQACRQIMPEEFEQQKREFEALLESKSATSNLSH